MEQTTGDSSLRIGLGWPSGGFVKLTILAVVLTRVLSLGIPELIEPTDARYAQISAFMVERNDWTIPHIQEDGNQIRPYWSKPPLAFWLMAASLKTFGHSVWAVRLPSALAWMFTALLIWCAARKYLGREHGYVAALLYMTTFSVYALAGTTLTDSLLTLSIVGSLLAFYNGISKHKDPSSFYVTALFLGLGILTKGPIALIFPTVSIALYILLTRNYFILRKVPWVGVLSLVGVISIPWFILAETRTPGYLRYFLFEENFKRFFSSSVELTSGSGHKTPFGFVLLLAPLMLLPWSVLIPILFKKEQSPHHNPDFARFAFCWFLAPTICLIFGRHVLPTYLLPVIPAFSLLIASKLGGLPKEPRPVCITAVQGISVALIFAILAFFAFGQKTWLGVPPHNFHLNLITALCIFSLMTILIYNKSKQYIFYQSALSVSFLLTAAILSSAVPLSMFKSASYLIYHLERDHHPSDTRVTFLNRVPLSAIFIRSGWTTNHPRPTAEPEAELMAQDCGIVVVREKDLPFMSDKHRAMNWEKVGRWRVLDLGTPHRDHLS